MQIEVFDVHRAKLCIGGGQDTIDQKFNYRKRCSRSRLGTGVVDEVAPEGTSHSVGILFLWAVVCAYSGVRWLLVMGNLMSLNPRDGVGSRG